MRDLTQRTQAGTTLSGVDALARLLVLRQQLDQRDGLTTATMVSGYPGSPLGGFDLTLDALGKDVLDAHRIVHRPGLNEELAVATVWGSQMGAAVPYAGVDGVCGAWYGKGPGLDRAGDAMKHANAMGAGPNGGAVMFCGDDPTAKSSTLPTDCQFTFEDVCMPVLVPGDQQDVIDLGVHAFRMSRYSGAWVGMKIVTSVADGIGSVDLDPEHHTPVDPTDLAIDGVPWQHQPLPTIGPHQIPNQEVLVVEHRLLAARAYARHNGIDRVIGAPPGAPIGVVCAGKTYYDVLQAFGDLGVPVDDLAGAGIRILKLGMTYPLVEDTIIEFAASVETLLVIEEKRPFVESQLRNILHRAGSSVPVLGKRDADGQVLAPSVGELDATAVETILTQVVPGLMPRPVATDKTRIPLLDLPARPPAFCSGCPHNRSTVFPDDALIGGGVGCHGMIYFEPRHRGMKSLAPTPMGAEGVPWIGLSPFVAEPHLVQYLGDGTLSHSGTLAIRACVAAGVDITFKILYNASVAMTGGQDVTGLMDIPALTRSLEAEGVKRIIVCSDDPKRYGRRARWAPGVEVVGRERLPVAQESLRTVPGVSVLVYDQQCAAEARRLRKRGLQAEPPHRVIINEAVCEGCGDCSTKSNCLSVLPVDTEFGEKRRIHDLSCNRDYTCLEGDCPSFVTITPTRWGRRRASRDRRRPALPAGTLPTPTPATVDGQYGVYFTGIGGTGVVTANRIVAAAAEAAGLAVGGLDQTGLSQKAGAVVSHLHLATNRSALGSATISAGGADLYLSGDMLQAASPRHLERVHPGRTIAVIERQLTPSGAMLQSDIRPPAIADLEDAIRASVGEDRVVFVDSQRIAETVFDNHLLANVVLLGAAYQRGALPVTMDDVEHAMARQGRAAADNLEAFTWGRWAAHDPFAVETALSGSAGRERSGPLDPSAADLSEAREVLRRYDLPIELGELLTRRAAQVIDYDGGKRARRYLDLVASVAAHDNAANGWRATEAVAEAWFKLLTYKDEYEVARLHLDADYDEIARELGIEGPYKVTYHLHPPVLRRMGRTTKLPMGRPYEVAFRLLRKMKGLRGTPFDVFGWDRDRRLERAVIEEYERLMRDALARDVSYDKLVELAASAMTIKGYGPIKERAVAAWRDRITD